HFPLDPASSPEAVVKEKSRPCEAQIKSLEKKFAPAFGMSCATSRHGNRRGSAGAEVAQFCIEFGKEHDREQHYTPVLRAACVASNPNPRGPFADMNRTS